MAPRKKSNPSTTSSSSSKKSNPKDQHSQPPKYGIQHFFERHTQNALSNNSQNPPNSRQPPPSVLPTTTTNQNPKTSRTPDPISNPTNSRTTRQTTANSRISNSSNSGTFDQNNAVSAVENPTKEQLSSGKVDTNDWKSASILGTKIVTSNPTEITPPENILPIVIDSDDNEPSEVPVGPSKSKPLQRLKFSPGMLIKQSQDDGGDEVTWKISPVNERLQMISKHNPETIRVLADASRLNSLSFRQCSQNKKSPGPAGKLEKWISSPILKTAERSLLIANKVGFKRLKPDLDMDLNGNAINTNNVGEVSQQSPFRTPPSLSYCHVKFGNDIACNGASHQPEIRQHKKALIELLDQVEDVISVEDALSGDMEACLADSKDRNSGDMDVKVNPAVKGAATILPEMVNRAAFKPLFLVLEVSEKRKHTESQCPFKVLRLLDEQSGREQVVHLWDEWFDSVIGPGDTIQVIGEFDDQGKCNIDRDHNFLIVHPDLLVSGTRVASSFGCPRRSVLDERLKCSEHSTAALIGTLLHQIFQAGLTMEVPTKDFLEEYASIVLQKNVESLYACGVNEIDMYKTLVEAVPKMLNWIAIFKDSQDTNAPNVDFGSDDGMKKVTISEVIDIEEMAWAPKYGLKGMIDASVRVKVGSNVHEVIEKIVPLEFKTGKATSGQSANEHRAQVILYTLLMSERYLKHIDSGLLYYLHTDQTKGIEVPRSELVGLIMRRNELASDILKASTTQQLPLMLQSPNTCKGCRHLSVCTVYHKAYGGTTESSGLGDVFDSHVHHLTKTHSDFLQHWNHLIDLEAKEMRVVNKGRWRSHNPRSDRSTSCLSSLVLDMSEKIPLQKSIKENQFIYRFVRQDSPSLDSKANDGGYSSATYSSPQYLDCMLKNGDYVMLSTKFSHLAVASGIIRDISRHHVAVSFSKRLRLPGSSPSLEAQDLLQEVWQIDKDESSSSFAVMRFNLVQLFLQRAQNSQLRKMIVDLEVPRFDGGCIFSQDPAISYIRSEKNLNNDQRRAILKILTAKDYALILGMPGTGKTSTMVHAVKALLMRGASVLLTSYTNSAVDNLLIKLKAQSIDFVRIGRHEAVHEEVRGHCISAMNMQSVKDIQIRLDQVKVVGVTCLGITSPLLTNKRFDICIMDEAGQTTLPVSLGPLMFASTFVLVGDHYQLPPLVQSVEARESGMGVSLFCRLSEAHPQAISALQSQYRMCEGIMELANTLIYGNRLRCGSSEIANSTLKLSSSKFISLWMEEVLKANKPVIFINTDNLHAYEVKDHKTVNNPIEALIVAEVVKELLDKGLEGGSIGIITPYNSQANLIRQAVYTTSVEIHTIDKYQGRDKDCILVSFVRSSEKPKHGTSSLLGDWHRINVALTRSKKKLIMVGSCRTLSKVPLLKLLIDKVDEQSGVLCVYKKDINYNGELKRCSQFR